MSRSPEKWFEVWFDQGSDLLPTYLLIVAPDRDEPGLVIVYDPLKNNGIVHRGQNYEDTCVWLAEDEYVPVTGRMFFDDPFPLASSKETK
jgi:dienelactone hydrolase